MYKVMYKICSFVSFAPAIDFFYGEGAGIQIIHFVKKLFCGASVNINVLANAVLYVECIMFLILHKKRKEKKKRDHVFCGLCSNVGFVFSLLKCIKVP